MTDKLVNWYDNIEEEFKRKPQIDKNSRNIIKLKRSQMSSANSSIINEII